MAQPIIQPSFGAGEISPHLYARTDLDKFHSGSALLQNFFVDYRGGASNRPGTQFIGQCYISSNYVRLIPFQFNTLQAYVLEFGNLYMRVIKDGGYVLEASQTITNITGTNPGVLTYAGADPANGDWMFLSGITGMTQLNGRTVVVTNVNAGANTFELYDTRGNPINLAGSAFGGAGNMARIYTLTTPYTASTGAGVNNLRFLKFAQSADVMTICHPDFAPRNLTRSGHAAWTLTAVSFVPNLAAPTLPTATPSTVGTTSYVYVITAIGPNGITESLPSVTATGASVQMSVTAGAYVTLAWTGVAGAVSYNVYRQPEVAATAPATGQLFGFVGSSTSVGFKDMNIAPDFTRTPPQANNPFAAANPTCVAYFQQRLCFAATAAAPETFWMSKTGDYFNFSYSIPSRADDSIIGTIASQQVNAIKHLVSSQTLLALSSQGAWKIDGGGNGEQDITPGTVSARPQSFNGAGNVAPISLTGSILYVQDKGSTVRDLQYNFYDNIFTGEDLTTLSGHLFFGHQLDEWAWAEEPFKLVWAIRDDGIMLSFTYIKKQNIWAWAHHDTQGEFLSVATIPEGDEDAVYVVVQRLVQGVYWQYVERLASRDMKSVPEFKDALHPNGIPADLSLAWFVDSGLAKAQTFPASSLFPTAVWAEFSIVGVTVIAGGSGYSPTPVVVVTDETGSGATFSVTVVAGVITAIACTAPGSNYTRPILTIQDTTGSGAAVSARLSRDVEMVANVAIFTSGDIGKMVRVNHGYGIVRLFNSSTSITVDVQYPLWNLNGAPPGEWRMTAFTFVLSGLHHLEGLEVAILADGNVQANQTVVNGAVTLPVAASSAVVGLPYRARGQTLYLDLPGATPTVAGKRKKISAVTLRVTETRGLMVGHDFALMREFKERAFQVMGEPIQPITGDERVVVDPLYDVPGQICWEQSYPLPATLLGYIPELTVGDT